MEQDQDQEQIQQIQSPPQKARGREIIIGSYRITKTLGQGTFGKVKEGIHILTQQKVAIKILEKNKITDVNDVERVSREIHILKIVRHPHIIQLYEIIETPTRLFLIMEHCCNGELFSYITSKNKLKEEEACRLFQQLISALDYLGRLGIAHRDVKPENLLLDEQLNLKMVDFGLSNMYKTGEKLATACGSPCYAAPELIKGLEYVGQKADLWSAGVVLYTMVCGHLPFEDSNTQSLYQKILHARYKFTCYLSQEIMSLVQNILVPDPELRYGLRQITSNSWYKKTYKPAEEIAEGIEVGIDDVKIFKNVLDDISQDEGGAKIDKATKSYIIKCLQANRHHPLTAHYYLLLKKKIISGEPLEDAEEGLPPSADLLMPKDRQTKKFHSIEPVRSSLYNEKNKYQLRKIAEGLNEINIVRVNPNDMMSPQSSITPAQNQLLLQSPDQMMFSPTQLESHGLISPVLVAHDQQEKLQLQIQKTYLAQQQAINVQQHSQPQSTSLSSHKNSYVNSVTASQVKSSGKNTKRPFQSLTAGQAPTQKMSMDHNKLNTDDSQMRPLTGFDLLTPVQQAQHLTGNPNFDVANDYNINMLSTNRDDRKAGKFKKNSVDRGYGKQKYSNKTSGSSGAQGSGNHPHSLLEKEIRRIMNQSQLVPSTMENELSFTHGSNLRKMANQRMSAMSNYQTTMTQSQRGSQSLVQSNNQSHQVNNQGQSQKLRQGKSKARQVTSSVKEPNIYVAKSIQDANASKMGKVANQHQVRKASLGVISPTQNNSLLLENKLVFSGSQLTTAAQKVVEQHTTTKENPAYAYGEQIHIQKQASSPQKTAHSNKKYVQKVSLQPATGESLEIAQIQSEKEPMIKTQQLSSLFKQLNSTKVTKYEQSNNLQNSHGVGYYENQHPQLKPSQITSPNNQQHQAVISQFSGGPIQMLASPNQIKQTPQNLKQVSNFQNMQLGVHIAPNLNSSQAAKRDGAKTTLNQTFNQSHSLTATVQNSIQKSKKTVENHKSRQGDRQNSYSKRKTPTIKTQTINHPIGKQYHLLSTLQNNNSALQTVINPQTTKQAPLNPASVKNNSITPAGGQYPKTTTYAQGPQGSRNLHGRAVSSLGGTVTSPQGPVISNLMAHNPNKVKRGSSVVQKVPPSNQKQQHTIQFTNQRLDGGGTGSAVTNPNTSHTRNNANRFQSSDFAAAQQRAATSIGMSSKFQGSGPWQQVSSTRANAQKPQVPQSITTKTQAAAAAASTRSKRAGSQGVSQAQQFVGNNWSNQMQFNAGAQQTFDRAQTFELQNHPFHQNLNQTGIFSPESTSKMSQDLKQQIRAKRQTAQQAQKQPTNAQVQMSQPPYV